MRLLISMLKTKNILKADQVTVTFPCCSENRSFGLDLLQKQWGVQKLYCKKRKSITQTLNKFTYNNNKIDFLHLALKDTRMRKKISFMEVLFVL